MFMGTGCFNENAFWAALRCISRLPQLSGIESIKTPKLSLPFKYCDPVTQIDIRIQHKSHFIAQPISIISETKYPTPFTPLGR